MGCCEHKKWLAEDSGARTFGISGRGGKTQVHSCGFLDDFLFFCCHQNLEVDASFSYMESVLLRRA